jgi:hypothetical protein
LGGKLRSHNRRFGHPLKKRELIPTGHKNDRGEAS